MPNLFPVPPTWEMPQPVRRRPVTPPAMPRTWLFDAPTGDFKLDGAGRVVISSERQSAAQAAAFLVTVQRGAYTRVFSRAFGIELRRLMQRGLGHGQLEPVLEARMRRSALRDARVRDLEEFEFDWKADVIRVLYTLVLSDGTRMRQEAHLH